MKYKIKHSTNTKEVGYISGGQTELFNPYNAVYWARRFKPNWLYFIVTFVCMITSIMSINKISEFLYF